MASPALPGVPEASFWMEREPLPLVCTTTVLESCAGSGASAPGAVAVAEAWLLMEPASRSACVAVCSKLAVAVAPGSTVAGVSVSLPLAMGSLRLRPSRRVVPTLRSVSV